MNYKHIKAFLIRKLEVALRRKWIDRVDKLAHILNLLAEVAPKSKNPYLPKEYKEMIDNLDENGST